MSTSAFRLIVRSDVLTVSIRVAWLIATTAPVSWCGSAKMLGVSAGSDAAP